MKPKFKIGDLVTLNSGVPQMTITVAENIHAVTRKNYLLKELLPLCGLKKIISLKQNSHKIH